MGDGRVDPAVLEALAMAMAIKESLVNDQGPGVDLPIWLGLQRDGAPLGWVMLQLDTDRIVPVMTMIVGLSDADQAIYFAEAYSYNSATTPPPYSPRAGDLARWFADGEPNTQECIQAVSAHRDGRVELLQVTYSYSGNTIVWGTTRGLDKAGSLANMLAHGFDIQKVRPTPPMPMAEIAASLDCQFVEPDP